jgi:Spy/CpxP family protein refolding chaperone
MKKFGIILLSIMLVSLAGIAQPRGQRNFDPEQMARRQTDMLKDTLELNEEQEQKVYELNLETGQKMSALRDEIQGSDPGAIREKMGEIRAEQNEKMKDILTEEQWEKYEKYLENMRARWQQRRGGRR